MGRMLVTDNAYWDKALRNMFEQYGFSQGGRDTDGAYLTTFRKLNVNNENFYCGKNGCIASSGTFIYDGMIGKNALSKVLEDFDGSNVEQIRSKTIGCYMLAIKKGGNIYVFVDENGTYGAYYFHDKEYYIITTTYYHIARCVNQPLNKNSFIEQVLTACTIDERTIFQNICRINGNECICIDIGKKAFTIIKVKANEYYLDGNGLDEQIKKFTERCVFYCEKKKLFGIEPMLFATGGTDSRLMLAMDIISGVKPVVTLWHGDPVEVQSYDEDLTLGKQLASIEKLETKIYDISRNWIAGLDNENINKLEKYGELSLFYGGSQPFFEIFESGDVKHAEFGSYGEILKNFESFNIFPEFDTDSRYTFTLDEYVTRYVDRLEMHVSTKDGRNIRNLFIEYLKDEFKYLASRTGMDYEKLTRDDCLYLYKFHHFHAESRICNFTNIFGYCYDVLAQKELMDYVYQFPYEIRNKKRLHLRLIREMCPELLTIDFFTHCQRERFDKDTMTLNEIKTANIRGKLRHTLKPIFMKTNIGRKIVYWYRHNVGDGKAYDELIKKYVSKIEEIGITDMIDMKVSENSFVQIPVYRDIYRHCVLVKHILKERGNHEPIQE